MREITEYKRLTSADKSVIIVISNFTEIAMSIKVITISREFGSGGRTIAKAVAARLNVPYYDKELVDKIALETGFAPEYVAEESEYSRSRSFLSYVFAATAPGGDGKFIGISNADKLWAEQCKIIQRFADEGPCVIVGRCSDYILRERTDCLNVFIHAPIEYRAERIVRLYGETTTSPVKRLEDKDAKRRIHYKHYTDRVWGAAQNYHLSLDSSLLGTDYCVDLIVDVAKNK